MAPLQRRTLLYVCHAAHVEGMPGGVEPGLTHSALARIESPPASGRASPHVRSLTRGPQADPPGGGARAGAQGAFGAATTGPSSRATSCSCSSVIFGIAQ